MGTFSTKNAHPVDSAIIQRGVPFREKAGFVKTPWHGLNGKSIHALRINLQISLAFQCFNISV